MKMRVTLGSFHIYVDHFCSTSNQDTMLLGFAPGDGRVVLFMQTLPALVTDPESFEGRVLKLSQELLYLV